MSRIPAPDLITDEIMADKYRVFVFGSNESGRHGLGAAKQAMKWGAIMGLAFGLQGQTYAIPTKDRCIKHTLPLPVIQDYVDRFINFAKVTPHITYLVTEIGCGLSHLTPEYVAPLFLSALPVHNIRLPKRFLKVLLHAN